MENIDKIVEHLIESRTLCEMERYQTRKQKLIKRSVAEHSWHVAKICQILAQIEIGLGNEVDMADLLQRAINHDVIEYLTGDIPSMTKDITLEIRKALEEVEEKVFESTVSHQLPQEFVPTYRKHMLYPKDDTIEGKILCGADNIDAIFEALEDMEVGNTSGVMTDIINRSLQKLKELDLESVNMVSKILGKKTFKYISIL